MDVRMQVCVSCERLRHVAAFRFKSVLNLGKWVPNNDGVGEGWSRVGWVLVLTQSAQFHCCLSQPAHAKRVAARLKG